MEVNLNSVQSTSPAASNNATGIAAPQTEAQRADQSVQRVTANQQSADLEGKASSSEERRFDAIKSRASHYVQGQNKILSDFKFTIYGAPRSVPVASKFNEYVVRFTDLKTGEIQVKDEAELFHGTSGGDVVSGQI